jgi:hypothetical protein
MDRAADDYFAGSRNASTSRSRNTARLFKIFSARKAPRSVKFGNPAALDFGRHSIWNVLLHSFEGSPSSSTAHIEQFSARLASFSKRYASSPRPMSSLFCKFPRGRAERLLDSHDQIFQYGPGFLILL